VVERSPSLDGAVFGTVFGFPLHASRDEFDELLRDFCGRQEWWARQDVRTVVELFRGDVERGVYLGLGAGQWTSMVIFATGVAIWAWARRAGARPVPAA
jgi:hypothetical protein